MTRFSPRRPGFALIEMIVTLVVLTVLIGLAAGLIRLLVRLDQSGRAGLDLAADRTRLARTLRDDAHRSASAQPIKLDGDHLTLALPDGQTADYVVRPRDILRELRDGDKIRQREIYRLPPRASARFETDRGSLLVLKIHHTPSSLPTLAESEDQLTAEVGRWTRRIGGKP